jgi:hypothetical protein
VARRKTKAHSRAPFSIEDHPGVPHSLRLVEILDAADRPIAHIYTRQIPGPEADANARLFEQAPRLVDVIRRFARGDMKLPHSEYDLTLRVEARALLAYLDGTAPRAPGPTGPVTSPVTGSPERDDEEVDRG